MNNTALERRRMHDLSRAAPFVVATTVAARLDEVARLARQMNLTAVNAKAVTARAGHIARGFRPITQFVDNLAHESHRLVDSINSEALKISRYAVDDVHARDAAFRLAQAKTYLVEAGGDGHKLDAIVKQAEARALEQQRAFVRLLRQLDELLEELDQQIRGIEHAASSCFVEAATAGKERQSLETVARTLREAGENMKARVRPCRRLLEGCYRRYVRQEMGGFR